MCRIPFSKRPSNVDLSKICATFYQFRIYTRTPIRDVTACGDKKKIQCNIDEN